MNQDTIKQFFIDRPAINLSQFEREINVPPYTLIHFIRGQRNLPVKHLDRLMTNMKKYGYELN